MPQYGVGYRDVDDTEKPLRKVIDAFKVGGSFGPGYYKRGGIKSTEKPGHFYETQTSYLGGFTPRSQYAGKKRRSRMSNQIERNRTDILGLDTRISNLNENSIRGRSHMKKTYWRLTQQNRTGISRNRQRIANNTKAIKKLQGGRKK
jgi:hypothetical protein